jgi:hypothetical protein
MISRQEKGQGIIEGLLAFLGPYQKMPPGQALGNWPTAGSAQLQGCACLSPVSPAEQKSIDLVVVMVANSGISFGDKARFHSLTLILLAKKTSANAAVNYRDRDFAVREYRSLFDSIRMCNARPTSVSSGFAKKFWPPRRKPKWNGFSQNSAPL